MLLLQLLLNFRIKEGPVAFPKSPIWYDRASTDISWVQESQLRAVTLRKEGDDKGTVVGAAEGAKNKLSLSRRLIIINDTCLTCFLCFSEI